MAIAALTTTTLTNAIDRSQTRFAIGSTTGTNGLGSLTAPQSVITIDSEAMLVLNVPVAGLVEVTRGANGTKAVAHVAGSNVYSGAKTQFGFADVDGSIGLIGAAGPSDTLPAYALPLGFRKRYGGKEYILCDFQETVHSGVTVSISNDGLFTASVLASSFQGSVGVVAEQTTSSDTWGWVQIYGSTSAQEAGGTSAATSAYMPIVAASVSSPAAGMAALVATTSTPQRLIYNMFITGAATTAVTSAASHTGVAVPVFLNYPYVLQAVSDVGFS
jgi:hypothetical protein